MLNLDLRRSASVMRLSYGEEAAVAESGVEGGVDGVRGVGVLDVLLGVLCDDADADTYSHNVISDGPTSAYSNRVYNNTTTFIDTSILFHVTLFSWKIRLQSITSTISCN